MVLAKSALKEHRIMTYTIQIDSHLAFPDSMISMSELWSVTWDTLQMPTIDTTDTG